jgi:Surface-adhesin protein E
MKSLLGKLGVILIGLATFGNAGCSSSPKYWMKADYDPYIYQRDEFFCKEQGRLGAHKSISTKEVYEQCMYTLGYFLTKEKEKWAGVKVGEGWKYYFSHAEYLAFYDAKSITRPYKDIVTVWVRWNLSKKFVGDFVREHGKEFENLSYIKQWVEVSCLEKKTNILSLATYNNEGILIFSSIRPWEWSLVIPELDNYSLYKEVCK